MIKQFIRSRVFVLFLSMLLIGFIFGFTYSVFTSSPKDRHINTSGILEHNVDESDEP